ncbi:MAG TPA: TetR family transcriptional regulator [Actinoplanes sp.]|jgi:AcrR family transcriptional regulator
MTSSLPAGLRERKKAKTRATIRETAMRLFEEQGYAATTVDQIADAAEVSPSTFFRYFPTKEDVVLTDDYDPVILAAVRAQPAGMHPIDAIIGAIRTVFGRMTPAEVDAERRRQRLFQAVPELQARMMQQTSAVLELFAEAIAEQCGLPPDDFSARVMAGAVIGAVLAVLPPGRDGDHGFPDLDRVTAALTLLRDGLPLGGTAAD